MNVSIHIEGADANEVRSQMAILLGTAAPAAVTAAAPAPAGDGKGKGKGKDKPNDPPAGETVQQTGQTGGPIDVFADKPAGNAAGTQAGTSATPAATTTAAAAGEEVTYEMLKTKMTELLAKKSAAFALDTLQKATGHKALTGMPKEMYPKAYEALAAALLT